MTNAMFQYIVLKHAMKYHTYYRIFEACIYHFDSKLKSYPE